jgi:hypothetical protein
MARQDAQLRTRGRRDRDADARRMLAQQRAEREQMRIARRERAREFIARVPEQFRTDAVVTSTASCIADGIDLSGDFRAWVNEYIGGLVEGAR